jgi:chromosome partitioning protein
VANVTKVFAIANQRCCVGKTTTAINLVAYLAEAGRKTLIIDIDQQCDATTGLGIDAHHLGTSIYEVLVSSPGSVRDAIKVDIRACLQLCHRLKG